jgi:pimeloyl-ACP methyl ester carboxylesterase
LARSSRSTRACFRGYGTTTFLSPKTPRNVDQAAFALDILALMDALGIQSAILAGYDWGSRTGDIIAALWPERVTALISVTGYLITNLAANKLPITPDEEINWWYQYYFSTPRGVLGLEENRYALGDFVWHWNSPTWNYSQETYARTATAFNNPDYVAIVIGNYRWRLSLARVNPNILLSRTSCRTPPRSARPRSPSTAWTTPSPRPATAPPTAAISPAPTST